MIVVVIKIYLYLYVFILLNIMKNKFISVVVIVICILFSCSKEDEPIVKSLKFTEDKFVMKIGNTLKLDVLCMPIDIDKSEFIWTSSDKNIATVSNDGIIKGLSKGKSLIKVSSELHNLETSCIINVEPISIDEIILSDTLLTLYVEEEKYLNYVIIPDSATYKEITWKSSDTKIFTIDKTGKILGVSPGQATAILRTKVEGLESICEVIVKPIEVENIYLSEKILKMQRLESSDLYVSIEPLNATNKKIIWESTDNNIATINSGKITAVSIGKCNIIAYTEDKTFSDTCFVEITPDRKSVV